MFWLLRYRIGHFVADSIWVLPCLGIAIALIGATILERAEMGLPAVAAEQTDMVMALLGTLASSMFTFIVFVSSALLLAVQLASASLTPRIIAFLFKEPATKLSLTLFAFTYTFTLAVLVRIGTVPRVSVQIAAYSSVGSLVVFLYLIDRVGKSFRPSGALRAIALAGRQAVTDIYPQPFGPGGQRTTPAGEFDAANPSRTVLSPRDGVVLAMNVAGLVALARRDKCVLELVPQVGAFVARGGPLFRIHRGGGGLSDRELCSGVALGQERNIDQDPAFAFRIIVDVACKALSPAINDPTTAVLALDHLEHLLRDIGARDLEEGLVADSAGQLRLMFRRPGWEDFVHLAVTEIRQYGGDSIQVARRLRAMLESLVESVPAERAGLLRQELKVLQRGAKRLFVDPEDLALANVSDAQGVGGKVEEDAGNGGKTAAN